MAVHEYAHKLTSSTFDVEFDTSPGLGSTFFMGQTSVLIDAKFTIPMPSVSGLRRYQIQLVSSRSSSATVYGSATSTEYANDSTRKSLVATENINLTSMGTARRNSVYVAFTKITASGGRSTLYSETALNVIPAHFDPAFNTDFTIERYSTSAGAVSGDGTKLLVKNLKLSWNASCGISGYSGITVRNARLYSSTGSQVGSTIALTSGQVQSLCSASGYSETSPSLLSGLSVNKTGAYRLEFEFGDQYETAKISVDIPLPTVIVDFGLEGGFSVGQYSTSTPTKKLFEVAEDHKSNLYGGADIPGINSYQSGEQLTGGTWIDGKPIYRYVGKFDRIGTNLATISNVDTVITLRGTGRRSDSTWSQLATAHSTDFNHQTLLAYTSEGGINIGSKGDLWTESAGPFIVIMEYTKTT